MLNHAICQKCLGKKKKVALKNPAMEQHKLAYITYIQDTFTLVEQNLRVTLYTVPSLMNN